VAHLCLALLLAVGLGQAVVLSQAERLRSSDPKVRAAAESALVEGAARSAPLLKRLLTPDHEDLHGRTLEIIRRIGPPAMPLLVELLRHESESVRRNAADALIDLTPHTETIQPALRLALKDDDAMVAGDAARALGALGAKAVPSVGALIETLAHDDPYVRIYAAEALASIGAGAVKATSALAAALADATPGVRWAACEALAAIGPGAQSAVPQLIEALKDEFLYVRIFAAGALGCIGPGAKPAREALKSAANDPALRDEVEWALSRIDGVKPSAPAAAAATSASVVPPPPQPPSRPAIHRSRGTPTPASTSPGPSTWAMKHMDVPSSLAMSFTSAPTTRGG